MAVGGENNVGDRVTLKKRGRYKALLHRVTAARDKMAVPKRSVSTQTHFETISGAVTVFFSTVQNYKLTEQNRALDLSTHA